mmetsp:Transcript_36826/g.60137  ORF Transcript_36826/g.60137 Transcript_36826/m.60137 type:complete len:213 (+) Transcript_36826:305-943(+)
MEHSIRLRRSSQLLSSSLRASTPSLTRGCVNSSTSASTLTSALMSSSTGRSSVIWKSVVTLWSPSWLPSRPVSPISMPTSSPRRSSRITSLRSSPLTSTPRTRPRLRSVPSKRRVLLTSTPPTSSTRAPKSPGLLPPTSSPPLPPEWSLSPPRRLTSEMMSLSSRWMEPSITFKNWFTSRATLETPTPSSMERSPKQCSALLTHQEATTELV